MLHFVLEVQDLKLKLTSSEALRETGRLVLGRYGRRCVGGS